MIRITLLSFVTIAVLINGLASSPSENRREVENRLREILGLHENRARNVDGDNKVAKNRKRLLKPSKALRSLLPEEEQANLAKRLAYTDPYYNQYLEDNQISGSCVMSGLTFQGGMTIHTDNCRKECYCPIGGGRATCVRLECDTPLCIDAVQEPDMCCAVCASGDNCLANNLGEMEVIPYGVDTILPHGQCRKRCMCPAEEAYIRNGRLTEAVCTPLC